MILCEKKISDSREGLLMENDFEELYRCLRLTHYKNFYAAIRQKPGSLTSSEAFSAETIYLLDNPTIGEFADFLGISQPNASYKANSLASKGFIVKKPCQTDRRECRLQVTQKFLDAYFVQRPNIAEITEDFPDTDKALLQKLLARIADRLGDTLAEDDCNVCTGDKVTEL